MIVGKLEESFGHIRISYKLVNLIGAIKNGVDEISLLTLLFQHTVHRIGKTQAILTGSVIYRKVITAAADLMISLPAFPVGIQPVPPGNDVFKFRDGAGSGFQTGQSFLLQLSFELFLGERLRFCAGTLFIAFYLYHNFVLPKPDEDVDHKTETAREVLNGFLETFASFFRKKQIVIAILFMLLFRLPEALLTPVSQLFLQAQPSRGGLGLSPQEFGLVNGTVGVIGLLAGGIIGGMLASRDGLKKWLWPMTAAITIPNVAYVYLAYFMPESLVAINVAVFLENFGYGFGFSAYMLFLIYFSQGEHKTSHYALCTGFMALSMMLPGLFAGALAQAVGYRLFFVIVMISCILPFIVAHQLDIEEHFGKK